MVFEMQSDPNTKADQESLKALARGALALYSNERTEEAQRLLHMIGSSESVQKALDEIVYSDLGVHLRPDD